MNLEAIRPRVPIFGVFFVVAVALGLALGSQPASAAGNPYDPCGENPYYYDSSDCYGNPTTPGGGTVGGSGIKRPSASLNLGKKCHKAKFKIRPKFRDGVVRWSTLWAAKKKVKKLSRGPYVYTVNAKKLKKNKKYNVKLFVIFTTGDKYFLKASFRTCK